MFNDGSLYLTRIQLVNGGNYSCHAERNKDVVQTHILTVHSEFFKKEKISNCENEIDDHFSRSGCARHASFTVKTSR